MAGEWGVIQETGERRLKKEAAGASGAGGRDQIRKDLNISS